jgi:hypothetical protein
MKANRRQSYVAVPSIEVIYEGVKSFWKTNTNLDVIIAYHPISRVHEVIAHDPNSGLESRVYVNSQLLAASISPNQVQEAVENMKEQAIRQKKQFELLSATHSAENNARSQFILSRLVILSPQTNEFRIGIQPQLGDKLKNASSASEELSSTEELEMLLSEKPTYVTPLSTNFMKNGA